MAARRSPSFRRYAVRPNASAAQAAARTATPAASSLWLTGSARLTATPVAPPAAAATSPASAARPVPRTASGPRICRVAIISGMATSDWPMVLPRASAGTTRRAGTTWASTASAAITASQLPPTVTAATFSRPMASITRDTLATTPNPARPGANKANVAISSAT